MKKRLLSKYFITLGLLLFFTFFLPELNLFGDSIAQASSIEKEKKEDYRLNLRSIRLVKGKEFLLRVVNTGVDAKVSFKSADSEIASVNENGNIIANKVGNTTVTAIIKDSMNSTTLICDVTVGPPAFSVKMTKSRIIIGVNQSDTLSVIMKPSNTAEDAKFSSFDSSIVQVSPNGRITANKSGFTYLFAEIDATNSDGTPKYATCSIIVTNADNVLPLKNYFNEHTELDQVSSVDLQSALQEFFNQKITETVDAGSTDKSATVDLVTALDKFLNEKFDLVGLRKKAEEELAKALELIKK